MTEEDRYVGVYEFHGKEEITDDDLDLIKFANENRKKKQDERSKK